MILGPGIWFYSSDEPMATLKATKRTGRAEISTITWDQERKI